MLIATTGPKIWRLPNNAALAGDRLLDVRVEVLSRHDRNR